MKRTIALLVLGSPVLLAGAFFSPFVDFDDKKMIQENPVAERGFTAEALEEIGRPPVGEFRGFYRQYIPLTYLTLGVQWTLHGPQLWAFRLVNLLFHLGSAILLLQIMRPLMPCRDGWGSWAASLGAAFFFFHPTNVESVAWACQRGNVQGLFFSMLAWRLLMPKECEPQFDLRLAPPSLVRLAGALLAFACALLSKPTAIGFAPFLFLASVCWTEGALFRRALRGAGFLALGVAAAYVGVHAGRGDLLPLTGGSHEAWALTSFSVLGLAVAHVLVPWPLSFFYGIEVVREPLHASVLAAAALLAGVLAVGIWLPAGGRRFGVLFVSAVLALGVKMTPATNAYLFQDRYLYFSLPLAAAALAFALDGWTYRLKLAGPKAGEALARGALSTAALACVALAALSLERSFDFGDSERLFRDAVAKQPRSYFARYLLAQKLLVRSVTECLEPAEAGDLLLDASNHVRQMNFAADGDRQKDPIAPELLAGEIDFRLGRPSARAHLEFVVSQSRPEQVFFRSKARWFLAELAWKEHRRTRNPVLLSERLLLLEAMAEENPGMAQVLYAKAETFERMGETDQALAAYRAVLADAQYGEKSREALQRLALPVPAP